MKNIIRSTYLELFNLVTPNKIESNILLNTYEAFTYSGSKKQVLPGTQIVIEKDYVYCIKPKNPQYFYLMCPVYGAEKIITVSKEIVEALQRKSVAFDGDLKQEFEDLKKLFIKNISPSRRKAVLLFSIDLKEKDKGLEKFFKAEGFNRTDVLQKESGAYKFCYLYHKLVDTSDIKAELTQVKRISKDVKAKFKNIRIIVECVYDINARTTAPKRFLGSPLSNIDKGKLHKLEPISLVKKYKLW
jgi:hypothetical protein